MRPLLLIALLCAFVAPVAAGEKAGVRMPDTIEVAGKRLVLNGMGLREATMFNVNVYVAGLYLERVSSDAPGIVASNQVKHLVLKFVRDVDRKDIVKAWREGFAKNSVMRTQTTQALAQLERWMTDFEDGDTLVFSYVPNEGVTVLVNGAKKGTIAGEEFSRALFSIWLGKHPPNKGLKKGILGNHGATS